MKRILTSLLAVLMLSTMAFSQTSKNFIDLNYIEVTGHSEKEIAPDQIYLSININEKDFKNQTIVQIEKSMSEQLKKLNIDISKDLSVKDMSSNFKNYWLRKADIIQNREYQLLVHDANTAGKVFMNLEKIGISNIQIIRLDHSKIEEIKLQLKATAMQNAKTIASTLTQAVNQQCGRAIHISENNNFPQAFDYMQRNPNIMVKQMALGAIAESEPEIEFEKIKLTYDVFVKFELK